jgi:hypothetical protein
LGDAYASGVFFLALIFLTSILALKHITSMGVVNGNIISLSLMHITSMGLVNGNINSLSVTKGIV